MKIELSTLKVSIMLNGSSINLPFLIDMENKVICKISDLEEYIEEVEVFTLHNKKMPLASYNPKDENELKIIQEIGSFWSLTKFENEIVTSFDVEYWGFISGTAIVYCLDTENPYVKVLLCFIYKGDAGRSAMVGLITKVAQVKADEEFFSYFT